MQAERYRDIAVFLKFLIPLLIVMSITVQSHLGKASANASSKCIIIPLLFHSCTAIQRAFQQPGQLRRCVICLYQSLKMQPVPMAIHKVKLIVREDFPLI